MSAAPFLSVIGNDPLVATAIHDGHEVRREVAKLLALGDDDRRREEDPYTGLLTDIAETRWIALRSRFEVDFNRPRDKAVYLRPEDAWGLRVWKRPPSAAFVARSLALHDAFYSHVEQTLEGILARHGRFIVLDLHSYNHRRRGPGLAPAAATENPEINIGSGSVNLRRWGRVVDRFVEQLRSADFLGRRLDVRENVKFMGGYFSQWAHRRFKDAGLVIAVDIKKFFMNEWTGELDEVQFQAIHDALRWSAGVLMEAKRVA